MVGRAGAVMRVKMCNAQVVSTHKECVHHVLQACANTKYREWSHWQTPVLET